MADSFQIRILMSGITREAGDLYELHVTELKYFRSLACKKCKSQCEKCYFTKEFCVKIETLKETIAEEPPLNKKDFPHVYDVKTDMDLISFHIYTLYLLKDMVCTQICKENCLVCFLRLEDKCSKILDIFHCRFDGCVINGEKIS
jgi:NifB/MoaA-like Fe-S oxidoreductase